MYVLIVENLDDKWDDADKIGRLRKWFPLEEAIKSLSEHKPVQQEYLERLSHEEVCMTLSAVVVHVNISFAQLTCVKLFIRLMLFNPLLTSLS